MEIGPRGGTGDGLRQILRTGLRTLSTFALLAGITGSAAYGVYWYQHRFVRSNEDLIAFLPRGEYTRFFVDVDALRGAGMLRIFSPSSLKRDPEYEAFRRGTQFDYMNDVDALAGVTTPDGLLVAVRGRFHWSALRRYALAHGGVCSGAECRMGGTSEGEVEFSSIQSDVLAIAFRAASGGNRRERLQKSTEHTALPADPIWIELSPSVLRDPSGLPVPLQIFAISLQSSRAVVFSIGAEEAGTPGRFLLRLDAGYANQSAANTIRNQMEIQTKMLKLELARERQRPDPGNLTGLLVSGSFQVVNNHVVGQWPISPELIQSLQ